MKKLLINLLLCGSILTSWADEGQDVCFFRYGAVVYETSTDLVDSVSIKDGYIILYDKDGQSLYSTSQAQMDSIRFLPPVPRADVLDVAFQPDGTAVDVSPMGNTVLRTGVPSILLSSKYGRYISRFDNPWAGTAGQYFRIDYDSNAKFRNALADGHTLEVLVKANYSGTLADKEAKYFSSHQGGGTGLMLCTKSYGKSGGNEITFLPNVSTNGKSSWKWATSGITPVSGQYYHVVGVWDKAAGKAHIYVDGQLKNSVAAEGSLNFPSSGCNWFAIGGDPSSATVANTSWNGDVVLARIYDDPLSTAQVKALYERVQILTDENARDFVDGVTYYSGMNVTAGSTYLIYGTGFQDGDQIILTEIDGTNVFTMNLSIEDTTCASFPLPATLTTGQYNMTVQRGDRKQDLGNNQLNVVSQLPQGSKVIAHRGFWTKDGAAQNSRQSLRQAFENNFYGSETDIWITTDGELVVNHDATLGGITLQTSTWEQVKDLKLSNGETIPRFSEFLDMLAASSTTTKLIIEIKTHSTNDRNMAAAEAAVAAVKEMGLANRVEYIAFSYDICKKIVALDGDARVGYLCSAEKSIKTPQELREDGISGPAYSRALYMNHLDFLDAAHGLGQIVNVWTVDSYDQITDTYNRGYDYITTNYPIDAQRVYNYYLKNK